MTIIFEYGDEFWIERMESTVTLEDAAGRYASGIATLERAGDFLSGFAIARSLANNDNAQAVGGMEMRNQGFTNMTFGQAITGVTIRVMKQIGTAGNTAMPIIITVFMRGAHARV